METKENKIRLKKDGTPAAPWGSKSNKDKIRKTRLGNGETFDYSFGTRVKKDRYDLFLEICEQKNIKPGDFMRSQIELFITSNS